MLFAADALNVYAHAYAIVFYCEQLCQESQTSCEPPTKRTCQRLQAIEQTMKKNLGWAMRTRAGA